MSNKKVVENKDFVSVKNGDWLRSKFTLVITALIPIAILIGMIYWFATKGASLIETPVVPVEKLDFERIILHPDEITAITSTGLKFTDAVEIAKETPTPGWRYFGIFAMLGVYVGVIPVYLGFLWFPFLRRVSKKWMNFFLSLTAGLLIFLGADALHEEFEVAERTPGVFQGVALITMGTLLSFLVLVIVGKRTIGSQAAQKSDLYMR